MDPILAAVKEQRPAMLATLERLVTIESPSTVKAAVDRCSAAAAEEFEKLGGRITWHRSREFGDHLQADFGPRGSGILLLGHLDTVWELGTLARMPFRIAKGRAWGPGVLDMKAGVVSAMFALQAARVARRVTVLLVSDEEVGSPSSRPITERIARGCHTVLVLEPATGLHGALKTARKGVGVFHIEVKGRAAHAGVDFEKGVSAIHELARQVQKIAGFTRLKRGLTVNVGVIGGGTRSNVVAEDAWAEVDVRISSKSDWPAIERRFRALGATGGLNRPPMERTAAIAALFRKAQRLGRDLGLNLEESMTGGGSDGNFTAALGIPTLDGLGAVGEGAHALNESILLDQFPVRTALLAKLLS